MRKFKISEDKDVDDFVTFLFEEVIEKPESYEEDLEKLEKYLLGSSPEVNLIRLRACICSFYSNMLDYIKVRDALHTIFGEVMPDFCNEIKEI